MNIDDILNTAKLRGKQLGLPYAGALTPQEAQKLANGLAPMLDDSADGLVQVKHADGSVSMDLEGRFQNVTVARVTADGTIEQSCVDNPRAAAKFFRIDPKLIENAPTARRRTKKD